MKSFCKVICALLILASVFGAFTEIRAIGDVKDCKAYWEKVGEESTASLNKLEDGIITLSENHEAYVDGKAQLAKGEADYATGVKKLEDGREELAAGIRKYNAGSKTLSATEKAFGGKGCPVLKQAYDGINELKAGYSNSKAYATVAAAGNSEYSKIRSIYENIVGLMGKGLSMDAAAEKIAMASISAEIAAKDDYIVQQVTAAVRNKVADSIYSQVEGTRSSVESEIRSSEEESIKAGYREEPPEASEEETAEYVNEKIAGMTTTEINQEKAEALENYMSSSEAEKMIASGVKAQEAGIMNQKLPEAKAMIKKVYENVHNLISRHSQQEAVAIAAGAKGIPAAQMSQAYNGYVAYTEGVKKLDNASAKLASGKQALASGEEELVAGRLKLMDGRKQLKEFEKGRSKLIDGLDTAMATEPEGSLESIKSRLGENFDYMAEDGENLNYDKAMMVVKKSREYQDDSTVAVTEELTGRITGAIAGLVAALFGIVAAVLIALGMRRTGFAAAVLCTLAAAACAWKVSTAGTVMSIAAGSQIGMMPVIAAAACILMGLAAAITALKSN